MKKKNRSLSVKPVILLSASALLLLGSTVGSTRAALTYYSENYSAQMEVADISVSLGENGRIVSSAGEEGSSGKLLTHLEKLESIQPGKKYEEELTVTNTGSIDSYVRVILTKYWTDEKGRKDTSLSPELIDLNLLTDNGWMVDEDASTQERTVLYYSGIVPAGESAPALSDTISIDKSVASKVKETVTEENGKKVITTEFEYDGYTFNLEAEVNAVQTHNARDAVRSAWGIDADVDAGGNLSLR